MISKKDLKQLAEDSYIRGKLDEKKVSEFTAHMDRKTLKAYLRVLNDVEKKKNVVIATASVKSYNTVKNLFENLFEDKHIITEEDPSLLLGLRITDNDMIYEKSLENSLDDMVIELKKNYN